MISACSENQQGFETYLGVAGDVANVFMIWWDTKLNQLLKQRGIEVQLYSRYFDDIDIVAKAVKGNPREPNDRETMREIANGIHESIKVTIDFPSKHANNRMPVKCRNTTRCQILDLHFIKPIASKHAINKNFALSQETKIYILVADLVRIMRNVSPPRSNTERTEHGQHFVSRLQFSGYPQKDRITIFQNTNQNYKLQNPCSPYATFGRIIAAQLPNLFINIIFFLSNKHNFPLFIFSFLHQQSLHY